MTLHWSEARQAATIQAFQRIIGSPSTGPSRRPRWTCVRKEECQGRWYSNRIDRTLWTYDWRQTGQRGQVALQSCHPELSDERLRVALVDAGHLVLAQRRNCEGFVAGRSTVSARDLVSFPNLQGVGSQCQSGRSLLGPRESCALDLRASDAHSSRRRARCRPERKRNNVCSSPRRTPRTGRNRGQACRFWEVEPL